MEYVIGGLLIGIFILLGIIANALIEVKDSLKQDKKFTFSLGDETIHRIVNRLIRAYQPKSLMNDGQFKLMVNSIKTKLNSIISALEDLIKK